MPACASVAAALQDHRTLQKTGLILSETRSLIGYLLDFLGGLCRTHVMGVVPPMKMARSWSSRHLGTPPGSVIIFVTLANGTRYAFAGDLVWQLEGMTLREERPWLVRQWADAQGTHENLLRMIALTERLPELMLVPAHDLRAFAELPPLSPARSTLHQP